LRIPKSLHAWLADHAQQEGVSLNTLVLGILSRARGAEETANPLPALSTTHPADPFGSDTSASGSN
jgi:hypothetical protein